jgi:hypothetical protein
MNVGVYIAEMFSTGNDAAKRAVITEELDLRALGLRAEEDAQWRAAPGRCPRDWNRVRTSARKRRHGVTHRLPEMATRDARLCAVGVRLSPSSRLGRNLASFSFPETRR